jgi:hypothetical protein
MKTSEGLEGHSTVTLLTLGSCLGLTRTHLQKKVCSNLYIYIYIYIHVIQSTYLRIMRKTPYWMSCNLVRSSSCPVTVQLQSKVAVRISPGYPADVRCYDGSAASCLNGSSGSPVSLLGHSGCSLRRRTYTALTELRENCYEMWQPMEEGGNGRNMLFQKNTTSGVQAPAPVNLYHISLKDAQDAELCLRRLALHDRCNRD